MFSTGQPNALFLYRRRHRLSRCAAVTFIPSAVLCLWGPDVDRPKPLTREDHRQSFGYPGPTVAESAPKLSLTGEQGFGFPPCNSLHVFSLLPLAFSHPETLPVPQRLSNVKLVGSHDPRRRMPAPRPDAHRRGKHPNGIVIRLRKVISSPPTPTRLPSSMRKRAEVQTIRQSVSKNVPFHASS